MQRWGQEGSGLLRKPVLTRSLLVAPSERFNILSVWQCGCSHNSAGDFVDPFSSGSPKPFPNSLETF